MNYTYDYAGASSHELLKETTPKGTYQLTYGRTDAQGLPVIEQLKKDNLTAYVEHDPVTGQPVMLRTASGKQALYIIDGTGNPAALITDAAYRAFAYEYDPYGTPTLTKVSGGNAVNQNPYLFKMGLQDRTTGWVKYGARWYNPGTGRWTQMDTLDTPLNPANANRYAYAANDPINNTDPLGRTADVSVTGCAIVCASFGWTTGSDGRPHFQLSGGLGADIGVTADIGGNTESDVNTGNSGSLGCSAAYGAGLYGQLSGQEGGGGSSASGGYEVGFGIGCNALYTHTF
ncbi:hypothetical protein BKD30_07530 [Tersicoccus phoenicis]|uniref:RHS repeat-associated core domain-containing protein n=1 Tax=Tersicoccus phoenicis TaxID=554083 RepID=A0A1R1LB49_9MICC|nr:RHS repeat-associated core domain-containing protein [Tersicoccus phoenicis]OMH24761.1 hypothetical protein BKD30_07530 [Tersicoccus phoenicis]